MLTAKEKRNRDRIKVIYQRTFLGQASKDEAMMCFGHLMANLRLWSELKTPEDAALHNAAMRILQTTGAAYVLDPKGGAVVRFELLEDVENMNQEGEDL